LSPSAYEDPCQRKKHGEQHDELKRVSLKLCSSPQQMFQNKDIRRKSLIAN
jgi:hypothetical protein